MTKPVSPQVITGSNVNPTIQCQNTSNAQIQVIEPQNGVKRYPTRVRKRAVRLIEGSGCPAKFHISAKPEFCVLPNSYSMSQLSEREFHRNLLEEFEKYKSAGHLDSITNMKEVHNQDDPGNMKEI